MGNMVRANAGNSYEHRVGLPPLVGPDPKVLILGTIPSVLSDRKQEYYGNPRNHFWKIMLSVFGTEPLPHYQDRLELLKKERIALWDVLKECDIDGSKDHSILGPVPNDIRSLLEDHPSIGHVFINGRKAQRLYDLLIQDALPAEMRRPLVIVLPSTSTANPQKTSEKIRAWKAAFEAL